MSGRYAFLLLRKHEIYLVEVYEPLLYAVLSSVFENDESVAGWKTCVALLLICRSLASAAVRT